VLDEEQTRLFLAEAKRSSSHYRLFLAAVLTGMRQGEVLGLRWRDINLTLGTISVQQTLYRLGKKVIVKEAKSARSRRVVDLPPCWSRSSADTVKNSRNDAKHRARSTRIGTWSLRPPSS
jgi:integrase